MPEYLDWGHKTKTYKNISLTKFFMLSNGNLTYYLDLNITNTAITKGSLSQIFDPLGLLRAYTMIAKIIL